ncbi:MAG: type I-D CRISPR-associated protein Cas7/Csc2, partial [Cyanobacteriota bacterium]|nr:type I-D CRISPR-associated protein Cas7/Csc2 [Cyanobacteriota bacterium]
ENDVISTATTMIENLMEDEFIVHTDFVGEGFTPLLEEVKALTRSEEGIVQMLQQANEEAKAYAGKHIKKKSDKNKSKDKEATKSK